MGAVGVGSARELARSRSRFFEVVAAEIVELQWGHLAGNPECNGLL